MNRFERLFFILEKNDSVLIPGLNDMKGVVKIILTADKIRVMSEVGGIPESMKNCCEICIFFKNKFGEHEPPMFIKINGCGTVRTDNDFPYNGYDICGVALCCDLKDGEKRSFPLISFKVKPEEWRELLKKNERKNTAFNEIEKKEKNSVKNLNEYNDYKSKPQSDGVLSADTEKAGNHSQMSSKTADENTYFYDSAKREELLHKNFVTFDPFNTTNSAYKWWRGTDMHVVNSIFTQIDIKIPFELNKDGYLSCELFGHVLIGLYKDKSLKREFLILGIPASCKSDPGNYYSNSRWEAVSSKSATGEQGYWLTYIDCDTSKVVKVI